MADLTSPRRSPAKPLPLDYETAPEAAPSTLSYRAYVGGVFYLEGIIVLILGSMLLRGYWPPVSAEGVRANPVSQLGLWLAGGALVYLVVVGIGVFAYNLLRPARPHTAEVKDGYQGVVSRARRYAAMRRRTYYIFDNTIKCQKDAEDAMKARDLY